MSGTIIKHVPLNLITNIFVFLLNIIVNILMTPFYITHLGVDGLGIVRLALLLPMYISLATIVVSGAIGRFLTLNIQEKRYVAAKEFFNTSLFGIGAIILIISPIMIVFTLNITTFLSIPPKYYMQASSLFLGVFFASQISVLSALFLVPAYANNRLDIQNYIKIITIFIQTALIVALFLWISSNISYIGYSYIAASLIGLFFSMIVWKEFAPFLKIHISFFKLSRLKEVLTMGSWLLINQLGSILFLSIDLLIINYFFGAEATGDYSIVLQWSILLRSMAGVISSVLGPIIVISYANQNFSEIITYSKISVKFMSMFVAIFVGIILGFSDSLFSLWVGSEFSKLVPLLWLVIAHLVINLAVLPLFSINTAYNMVKVPALVSLGFGFINLLLAIALAAFSDLGLYGIALASAIVLTLKNAIFTPIYAASILNISTFIFIKEMRTGIVVLGVVLGIAFGVNILVQIDQWIELIVCGSLVLCIVGLILWNMILSKDEIKTIKKVIKRKGL